MKKTTPKKKATKTATKKKVVPKVAEKEKKGKAGRKLFDGKDEKDVLSKLEEAFKIGCTDEEACFNADISVPALHRYEKANPSFRERKHRLKERPVFIARKSVISALEKDGDLALKYLERKKKDEFSTKSEVEATFNEVDETRQKLKKILSVKSKKK